MSDLIDESPPSEMSHDELRNEYGDISERLRQCVADPEENARLGDRRSDLWNEMVERVDAEPPECPECGGTGWTQSIGDPKYCTSCGLGLGFDHEDVIAEVDAYWEAIFAGPQDTEGDR